MKESSSATGKSWNCTAPLHVEPREIVKLSRERAPTSTARKSENCAVTECLRRSSRNSSSHACVKIWPITLVKSVNWAANEFLQRPACLKLHFYANFLTIPHSEARSGHHQASRLILDVAIRIRLIAKSSDLTSLNYWLCRKWHNTTVASGYGRQLGPWILSPRHSYTT